MKNIILLINIKNPDRPDRNQMYNLSIESWKRWALKNDCEVFVLEEPVVPISEMTPIVQRHYVFQLLEGEEFDQILMVDADTIVHPNCPNFFELTNHQFCAVHNDGDYDWLCRSVENYEYEFFGTDKVDQKWIWNYFNTGFMITNKNFKFLHERVLKFYWDNQQKVQSMQQKYGVGTDQPLINMIIRHSNDIEVKLLPYQFNMQDLQRKNILDERMLFLNIPGVYHFNAVEGGPEKVNYWMKRTFDYLYNRPTNLKQAIETAWDKTTKIHPNNY